MLVVFVVFVLVLPELPDERRPDELLPWGTTSAAAMLQLISFSRNANEMWKAVQKWLPLYMTGAISPYYYPRLRDGIWHRTIFVARGHSAMVSSSVQGQTGERLNLLLRDKSAVDALKHEFNAYLALCRPLMEIAYPKNLSEVTPLYRAFLDAPGDLLLSVFEGMTICLKEETGALIVKNAPPYAAFSLNEPRMVSAVEEYMLNLPEGGTLRGLEAAEALKKFI